MKKLQLVLGLIIFLGVFSTGCLNEKNKIPPNCFDGILNNGEEKIDCGGDCVPCNPCENGLWDYELGETWVDCGGDCGECPPHANGCQDEGESGVDCGGTSGIDCSSLCNDGLPNGWEDGVIDPETQQPYDCPYVPAGEVYFTDCGLGCEPCEVCNDGILNQDEQWIDCGGICGDCGEAATGGSCINGFQDGEEVDVDCGGVPDTIGSCPHCDILLECDINGVHHDFTATMDVTPTPFLGADNSGRVSIHFSGVSLDGWAIEGQFAESLLIAWPDDGSPEMADVSVGVCNELSYLDGAPAGCFLKFENVGIVGGVLGTQNIEPLIYGVDKGITYDNFTKLYKQTPGYYKGEFSGQVFNAQMGQFTQITNGKFKLIAPWSQ